MQFTSSLAVPIELYRAHLQFSSAAKEVSQAWQFGTQVSPDLCSSVFCVHLHEGLAGKVIALPWDDLIVTLCAAPRPNSDF